MDFLPECIKLWYRVRQSKCKDNKPRTNTYRQLGGHPRHKAFTSPQTFAVHVKCMKDGKKIIPDCDLCVNDPPAKAEKEEEEEEEDERT